MEHMDELFICLIFHYIINYINIMLCCPEISTGIPTASSFSEKHGEFKDKGDFYE